MLKLPAINVLLLSCSLAAGCLPPGAAVGDDAKPRVDRDGTITTVAARLPFSTSASPQALKRFQEILLEDRSAPGIDNPLASRKFYDKINSDRAGRMRKLFSVTVRTSKLGGVPVDIVSAPDGGADDHRILINLHGGAFLWGAGSGGLVESIPVAGLSKIQVVSVDYREGPEDVYPAASEDVEKVYRAVLQHHSPDNVGIYGCSAGGILTAESVAWFQGKGLPAPGAIGIFCAGAVNAGGDSAYTGPMLMGQAVPEAAPLGLARLPYFKGADIGSPLVLPGTSPKVLARFPPTLLISGTRDMSLSAVLRTNELLTQAGVATELHVWEGMWHSFFSDPELPESRAAYEVMAKFFVRRLKGAP